MIPLIKYNIPTINGRIYRKGCFINLDKIKDSFFIEKPRIDNDLNNIVSLSNVIFTAKLIEKDDGLFLTDLDFLETDENKNFLSVFENQKLIVNFKNELSQEDLIYFKIDLFNVVLPIALKTDFELPKPITGIDV
mgnify:CR=1 FL=1